MIALLLFLAVEAQPVPDAGVAADAETATPVPVEDAAAQGDAGPFPPDGAARETLPPGRLRGRVLAKGTRTPVFAAAIIVDQSSRWRKRR